MEDTTPERQNTSLLDGEPSAGVGMGPFPAIADVGTSEMKQAQKVNSRDDLDLQMDQFADCEDFGVRRGTQTESRPRHADSGAAAC